MKKFTITEQERKRIQRLHEIDFPNFKTGPSSYEVAKAVGFTEAKRKKECYEIMIIDTTGYHNIISNICDNGYFDIKNESSSVGSAPTTGKWVIENNTIKITLSDGKTFSGPISDKSLQSQITALTNQVGSTSAANTAIAEQKALEERQRKENALTSLTARFSQYGLASLVPKIRELVINGST
jgi:hypothetical protein